MRSKKGISVIVSILLGIGLAVFVPAQARSQSASSPSDSSSAAAVADFFTNSPSDSELDDLLTERQTNGQSLQELPPPLDPTPLSGIPLPLGQESFKIEVNQDGIYQLSYSDLQNAGMDVGSVNPNSLQMIYRGQNVAYQFIGDLDSSFESGEAVRFYGQTFKGSRLERQYITNNVYWLWANGTPTTIATGSNPTGFAVDNSWLSSITSETDYYYFPSFTNQWATFPNEPDSLFITRWSKGAPILLTNTLQISLPDPAIGATDGAVTVEVNSQTNPVVSGVAYPHLVRIHVNGAAAPTGSESWLGIRNVNITGTVPASSWIDGINNVEVVIAGTTSSTSGGSSIIYPNRLTVDYQRQYVAVNDQLIFQEETGGNYQFDISGYTSGDAGTVLVWNITDPYNPIAIPMTAADISGSGPFTYRVGSSHTPGNDFIATTTANLLSPMQITSYTASDLNPVGGAEWLAITHTNFAAQATQLANHRQNADFGNYTTHVVNIADIIAQYGYGLPIPGAIRNYLAQALSWATPPRYVTLIGDATFNPRQLLTNQGAGALQEDFVPTELAFIDRFQGQVPADTILALLTDNDYIPDLAIGRLPASSVAEAQNMVDKIIQYDQNQLSPAAWMENILFAADNPDSGGDFCTENATTASILPSNFAQEHICMIANTASERDRLRDELFNYVNITSTLLLNYRGHGSFTDWAAGAIDTGDSGLWANGGQPVIILSADCLDGSFVYPHITSLSESFIRLDDQGSVAHWSSTGLGYSYEHTVLHENFYVGLLEQGHTAIGDAVQYAKEVYEADIYDIAELLAFTLHGDPAMEVMRPDLVLDKQTVSPTVANPNDLVTFGLTLENAGIYPSPATLTDTLPNGLNYISYTASAPITVTNNGNQIILGLDSKLAFNETVWVTLTTQLDGSFTGPSLITNTATSAGPGLDLQLPNNSDISPICNSAPPPAPTTISISRSGTDLTISWSDVAEAANGYEVWQSGANYPYFVPGDPGSTLLGTVTTTSFIVTSGSGVGDLNNNYSYLIRAVSCANVPSAPSKQVGEFDFAIQPGISNSDLRWSSISIPLSGSGIPTTADAVASYVSAGNIKKVARWNASTETWSVRTVGAPFGTPNFTVAPGDTLLIGANHLVPAFFTWVGLLPDIGTISQPLIQNSYNFLMIPLDQRGNFTLTADSLAADIGGVTKVARWNAGTQTWTVRTVGAPFGTPNYTVFLGYPYLVLTSGSTPPTWP